MADAASDWIVCSCCERAFDRSKSSGCPFCGEGSYRCVPWVDVRAKHPDYPEVPVAGEYYGL